ncbi:unnamed protein product [Cladocopium goreaui]|uniref:Uncharacterized protein n=1 Tax=Cladocopium goreaui TaxID=2562237 RepID=A0A9P1DWA3_9DINO|nr:unnamed protein product [Cladocopium goreaui]
MLTDDVSMRTMKVMIPGPMNTRKLREAVADCGAQVVRSYIASPRFFHSKGTKGMLVPYRKVCNSRRRLAWVSREFRALHPDAAGWVDAAPSPWIIMADKDKFVERARRYKGLGSTATAFVSTREQQQDPDLKNILYKVTANDAMKLFLDIDGSRKMIRIWSSHKK